MAVSKLSGLLAFVGVALAPAMVLAGPIRSGIDTLGGEKGETPVESGVNLPMHPLALLRNVVSVHTSQADAVASAALGLSVLDIVLARDLLLLPALSPVNAAVFDIPAWVSGILVVTPARKALEGEDREIELLPSLITFFCNPYRLDANSLAGGSGVSFRSDTRPEIDFGLMGRLGEDVRVAIFSTLSTVAFTDDILNTDRRVVENEIMTHRFALLLSVSPARDLFLGAAGGAEVVDKPRSYVFEMMFEARLQF